MTTITTATSYDSALGLLSGKSAASTATASASSDADASSDRAPASSVELSDRAQALLARAKYEQAAADKLAAQLTSASTDGKTAVDQDDGSSLFDRLTGRGQQATASDDRNDRDAVSNYLQARIAAHTGADGSVAAFSETVTDFITVPTTPAQVDDWYKLDGQAIIDGAAQNPAEAATGIADAVQSRNITFLNATDIPGLNFSNSVTFQSSLGSSANGSASYDHNAAIFKDPTTNYRVYSNGTVIAWPKVQASG